MSHPHAMRTFLRTVLGLALVGPSLVAAESLVVTGASLWTAQSVQPDWEIVIQNGRVTATGAAGSLDRPAGARVLDAAGDTLLPGLIDAHVHLVSGTRLPKDFPAAAVSAAAGQQLLRSGVTSGRIHLWDLPAAIRIKHDSASDAFPSPRFVVGGPALFGGQPTWESPTGNAWGVKSAADAIAKVRRLKAAGVDWIALHALGRFEPGELVALAGEARQLGIRLMAGGDTLAEIERAVDLGVDSLEYLDRSETPLYPESLIARMKRAEPTTYLVPVIGFPHRFAAYRQGEMRLDDPRLIEFLPPPAAAFAAQALVEDRTAEIRYAPNNGTVPPPLAAKFRQLHAAGLPLVTGSDCGSPIHLHADSIWWEMETMRQLGLPATECIRAATETAASLLRQTDTGHLAAGARGDFVLYRGAITDGPLSVERVRAVAKGGVLFVDDGQWLGPAAPLPVVHEYRTTAGPLQLSLSGAAGSGKYRITVKSPPDEGTFAGTMKDGLLDAVWTEPGKSGRLLLAFNADFSRFYAIYNNSSRPEHWYGEWTGVNEAQLADTPDWLRAHLQPGW